MLLLYLVAWISAVSAAKNSSVPENDQDCGGTSNSSQFSWTSPGLPARYAPGLRCSWTVATSSSACILTLDLGDLRLPPCPSDQLVVGGAQLCGDLPRVIHLPLHFPLTNVTFRGNPDGGPGFNISVRQIECSSRFVNQVKNRLESVENYSCGGEFYGDNVIIESPGYPSSYPPEAHCRYTIRRANEEVCQVEVTFENSSLEMSDGCYKDRIEIQGDRLCGELKGVGTYGIDRALEIRFVSDSEGSGKGFKLLARQIKCADTPIVVDAPDENDKQDVLVDCGPQGASIVPPDVGEGYPRVRRPFPPFPLPGEVNRNYPPLQIYPHPQNYPPHEGFRGNPPVQRIPPVSTSLQFPSRFPSSYNPFNKYTPTQGYIPPDISRPSNQGPFQYNPNFPSSSNTIYIPTSFLTPSTTPFSQGQQCCGRVYSDSHFLIVSPGFPRSQSSDCVYTIQRYSPLTFQLRFRFRYFWVGQDTGDGCSGGALEIDGNGVCGCKTGIIWTSQFYDSEAVKVLHLRLDPSVDRLFSGFAIEVFQDDSYSGRYKRSETNPSSDVFTLSNGKVVNFTQNIETIVERVPLGFQINENQLVDRTHSQLVWDQNRQTWVLPTDLFCLRWSYQDWILLAKEALWSQYQCPVSVPPSSVSPADSSRFEITACRTCYYFCRQNCQCC